MLLTLQSFKAACAALMHAVVAGLKAEPPGMVVVVVLGTKVVDVVLGGGVVDGFSVVEVVVPWMVVVGFSVVDVLVGRAVDDVELVVVVVRGRVEDVLDDDVLDVVEDVLVVELVVVVGCASGRLAQLVMHEPRATRQAAIGVAGGHPKLFTHFENAAALALRQAGSPRHRGPAVLQAVLQDCPQLTPFARVGSSHTACRLMQIAAQE